MSSSRNTRLTNEALAALKIIQQEGESQPDAINRAILIAAAKAVSLFRTQRSPLPFIKKKRYISRDERGKPP